MAKRAIDDTTMTDIAEAIREKTGGTDGLLPAEMPPAIRSIKGGGAEFTIAVSADSGSVVTATKANAGDVLKYIESAGAQYIDTGIIPNQDTEISIKFRYIGAVGKWVTFAAAQPVSSVNDNQVTIAIRDTGVFSVYVDNQQLDFSSALALNDWHTVTITRNAVSIDGETKTNNTGIFDAGIPFFLFAGNIAGKAALDYSGELQMEAVQIIQSGEVLRRYVPFRTPYGDVGLMDQENYVFYPNAGSEAFIAGEVSETIEPQAVTATAEGGVAVLTVPEAGIWQIYVDGIAAITKVVVTPEYSLEAGYAGAVSYTGAYTDETVEMTDGTFRLLTLTGSGTLTFEREVIGDIWLCGAGAGGKASRNVTQGAGGGGGGGGYCKNLKNAKFKTLMVAIGAGGAGDAAGNATTISGDVSATVNGGGAPYVPTGSTYDNGGDGGSGGGAPGYYTSYTNPQPDTLYGVGAKQSTVPFEDKSLQPKCGGGAGGGYDSYYDRYHGIGGNGGSSGADGTRSHSLRDVYGGYMGGVGGKNGGGDGGTGTTNASACAGESATDFGGGGGGGARYIRSNGTGYNGSGGAGYQGCVMIRIPV